MTKTARYHSTNCALFTLNLLVIRITHWMHISHMHVFDTTTRLAYIQHIPFLLLFIMMQVITFFPKIMQHVPKRAHPITQYKQLNAMLNIVRMNCRTDFTLMIEVVPPFEPLPPWCHLVACSMALMTASIRMGSCTQRYTDCMLFKARPHCT